MNKDSRFFHLFQSQFAASIRLALCSWFFCFASLASYSHAQTPITSSGLSTQVNLSATPPAGKVQYDITGGSRPGGGTNLFHSFGDFNVPSNNIANFLNETALPTNNILGRVTGGNISNIFGTIQTTGFGNANLFLMNPGGFLFGPNATVNVGGMVAFTSADYLKLADNKLFTALPSSHDALLTASPVTAFGFLGSNPGAITVQGSHLTVTEGQALSLVGGNISVEAGTLANNTIQPAQLVARGGRIHLASVASPGEILAGTLDQAPNINGQSFGALGTIQVSQQSVIDFSGDGGGSVLIRGGRFVLDESTISANITGPGRVIDGVESIGGGIGIMVSQDAVIQNGAILQTDVLGNATPGIKYGGIHINADRIEVRGVLDFEAGNIVPTTIQSNVASGSTGGNSGDIKLDANSILVKDFGILNTQTDSAGNSGNIILKTTGNLEADNVAMFQTFTGLSLLTPTTMASGNAGNIELTSTHGNVLLTNTSFVTSQSQIFGNGGVGSIIVNAPNGEILLTGSLNSGPSTLFTSIDGTGANAGRGGIQLTAQNLTIENSGIQIDNFTPFQPGSLTVNLTGRLSMSGDISPPTLVTTTRRSARSADLNITAHDVLLTDGSLISTETFRSGDAGTLNIFTENLQITNGAQIRSSSRFNPVPDDPITTPSGAGGTISIQGLTSPAESVLIDGPGSGIFTDTRGTGAGGNILVNANSVTLHNGGTLSATTSGPASSATGGMITVHANQIQLNNQASITATSSGAGNAGTITMTAEENIVLLGNSSIASAAEGEGNGGLVSLTAPSIELHGNSNIVTSTAGLGNAGDIELQGNQVNLTESFVTARTQAEGRGGNITIRGLTGEGSRATDVRLSDNSQLVSETIGTGDNIQGAAGNILVETARLNLSGGSLFNTTSRGSTGAAGNITVNATDSLTISGFGTQLNSNSMEFSFGDAGHISISAPSVVIENNGFITTSTSLVGNAGTITVNTNNLQLLSGGHITSSSLVEFPEAPPSGAAGTVSIQGASPAQSVLIDGPGSGIFTDTRGTGAGGNILVNANSVTLHNGGTLSASSTGLVEHPGNAGNIEINATNGLTMQNSAITTQAGQGASGGNIKVTTSPEATVWLQNSKISASVADGPGGGGNVSIDPQFVILQNSQILAQAAQGQGGAITITTSLFLPDANSIVNADSGSGVNGTVTIQSPNAPASGKIQPLGKSPLQATSLLNQRCASLAGGEFSSFTVAGRDSLPTEPGSWLTSPLALGPAGFSAGTVTEGGEPTRVIDPAQETTALSLRQIAPAGFLTQAFAVDWSAGCQS